jgi:hypothetical protein
MCKENYPNFRVNSSIKEDCLGFSVAIRDLTRQACDDNIKPSSIIFRLFATNVAPDVVISTIASAMPLAGAPSVAEPE